eukprot:c290_g1_i1.p1 GENE.c290_g1_i1~~c290_g1_i1.p1  ORF type:complete len:450 (+),score=108.83 c290_g1_i1:38-1387(+)
MRAGWLLLMMLVFVVVGVCLTMEQSELHDKDQAASDVEPENLFRRKGMSWGLPLTFGFVSMASAAGLGGGGALVPVFILVLGLSPKHAIPLSKCTIFGGSIVNIAFYLTRKHPDKSVARPIIDYDLLRILEPTTLLGTTIGVVLNIVCPTWIILLLLIAVLAYATKRAVEKFLQLYRKETVELKNFERMTDVSDKAQGIVAEKSIPKESAEIQRFREMERKQFPLAKIGIVFVTWGVLVASSIITKKDLYPCGSFLYWAVLFSSFPVLTVIVAYVSWDLEVTHKAKVACGYPFLSEDVHWTRGNSVKYSVMCVVAGLAAALLGIGGAMVKTPLMLEMGVNPQIATATAVLMIFFTASASSVQYFAFGTLERDAMFVFAGIGFLGALFGQLGLEALMRRYKRPSVLVLLLAIVMVISVIMMSIVGVIQTIDDFKNGRYGFTSICAAGSLA